MPGASAELQQSRALNQDSKTSQAFYLSSLHNKDPARTIIQSSMTARKDQTKLTKSQHGKSQANMSQHAIVGKSIEPKKTASNKLSSKELQKPMTLGIQLIPESKTARQSTS